MAGPKVFKNHCVAFLGEFVGTFLFLFFAFAGTQIANEATITSTGPDLQRLLYISLIFGFSLAVNVWVFFRVSGGLFNPAVTLALWLIGVVPAIRSLVIFIAQLVGGIAAAAVVRAIIPSTTILFNTALAGGTNKAQGLFLEMFLTCELVFTVLMLAAEKTKATYLAPVGIGLSLFIAELIGAYWTGGSLNPARSFGPDVVRGRFEGYHWIYWVGPLLGALLASGFYKLLKVLKYEEVSGDQDKSAHDEKVQGTEEVDHDEDADNDENNGNQQYNNRYFSSRRAGRNNNKNNEDIENAPSHCPPQTQHRQNLQYSEPTPRASQDSRGQSRSRSKRSSRAFAPEADPLGNANHSQQHAQPSPVRADYGQVYVQDADAQIRRSRSFRRSRREERRLERERRV